ncbi:MAG: AAA family ATPase [Actinobacteria bacterium]|nr:AAA family ATPase [Actinomycetota bacterium]
MAEKAEKGLATLLFSDLAATGALSDLRLEDGLRTHFRLIGEAVADAAPESVRNLGDGVLVCFASPVEALRSASALQRAAAAHNRRPGATPVAPRVALHVGDPVAEEADVFSTGVLAVRRLCSRAGPGEIVASDLVRGLVGTRGSFRFGPFQSGDGAGRAAWTVTWEAPASGSVLPPALAIATSTPLADRTVELGRLARRWDEARAGATRLVMLAGEPGIGKTRLCAALAQVAHDQGATVLYGRSDEEALMPYQPFVEALRLLSHDEGTDVVAQLAGLARTDDIDDDPETGRYRLFRAVATQLAAVTADAPVLLVLDDLHWADRPTILLLRHLVRASEPGALLIVGTYRDSEVVGGSALADALGDFHRTTGYERLRLTGLDRAGVASLIGPTAGGDRRLADAVFDETEGNPFFVTEIVRHLAEIGAIRQEAGAWHSTTPPRQLSIPEGVREVVSRRVARLSEPANRVLALAAAVGRDFELHTLAQLAELDEDTLIEALDEAIAAQVLVEPVGQAGRYSFSHALVRRTLYDLIGTTRRVRLHQRVGEVLERLYDGDLDVHAAELAHHFREAAGAADPLKTAEYAARAGRNELALLAYEKAASHFAEAIEILGQVSGADEAEVNDLVLAMGDAQWRAGRAADAHGAFVRAAETARRLGRPDQLARAALGYGGGLGGYGWAVRADPTLIGLLEDALEALGPGDSVQRVRLLGRLATELYYTPEVARRSALADEAVAMAERLHDQSAVLTAKFSRSAATWGPDLSAEHRLAASTEIVRLAAELDNSFLLLEGRSLRVDALVEMGQLDAAAKEHDARCALAEQLRLPRYVSDVSTHPAACALLEGHFDEAQQLADRARELGESIGSETAITVYGAHMICLAWMRGELAGVEELVVAFADAYPWIPAFRAVLAFVHAQTGELEAAAAEVERLAVEGLDWLPRDGIWSIAVWALCFACAEVGDADRCAQLYELLLPHAETLCGLGAGLCLGSAHLPLAITAACAGLPSAASHFSVALEIHERLGARPFAAETRYRWAMALRGTDDDTRVSTLLNDAAREAESLGMAGLLQRCQSASADATRST